MAQGPIKLHKTGSAPRPRHPSGAPTITPLKGKPFPAPWEKGDENNSTDSDSEVDGGAHPHQGQDVGDRIRAARAAQREVEGLEPEEDLDPDEDSQWEAEAADELASDIWMDELEHRMQEVYEKVGQRTGAAPVAEGAEVNESKAWMEELEQEVRTPCLPVSRAEGGAAESREEAVQTWRTIVFSTHSYVTNGTIHSNRLTPGGADLGGVLGHGKDHAALREAASAGPQRDGDDAE
jgi:hypothetical protein